MDEEESKNDYGSSWFRGIQNFQGSEFQNFELNQTGNDVILALFSFSFSKSRFLLKFSSFSFDDITVVKIENFVFKTVFSCEILEISVLTTYW